jgi:hypothetical protein
MNLPGELCARNWAWDKALSARPISNTSTGTRIFLYIETILLLPIKKVVKTAQAMALRKKSQEQNLLDVV